MKINKMLWIIALIFVVLAVNVNAATTIIDSFNRSDRNLNGDTADIGDNWSVSSGAANIVDSDFAEVNRSAADSKAQLILSDAITEDNLSLIWYQRLTTGGTRGSTRIYNSAGGGEVELELDGNAQNIKVWNASSASFVTHIAGFTDNVWYRFNLTANFTSNTFDLDINGTLMGPYGMSTGSNFGRFNMWAVSYVGGAQWDEIYIVNGTTGGGAPSTFDINFTTPNPPDNTQYNFSSIEFNVSANSSEAFDCDLIINGTVNDTNVGYTAGTDIEINFSVTMNDGHYGYYIRCYNATLDINTTVNDFYVDTVVPTVTDDFINNSNYYRDNLTGQFNFSDDQILYSYNISIDGSQIDGASGIGGTFYSYNLSYNISALSVGEHTLTVRYADGHTRKELRGPYDVEKGRNLKFNFPEGGWVKIKESSNKINDYWDAEKQKDRYTFNFKPSSDMNSYTFEISSDKYIDIINAPGTEWGKWLVVGDHWLDFYQPQEINQELNFNRVNDNKILVTVTGLSNKSFLEFSSIGDLNIVSENFTFFTTKATMTYAPEVTQYEEQTISLLINLTDGIMSTYAELYWNTTNMSLTKTSTATYDLYSVTFVTPAINDTTANVSINWTYDIIGNATNESGSILKNQTIYLLGIDNCSTYTTQAINFTLINSSSGENITGTMAGHFTVWVDDASYNREFNLTWGGDSIYQLCISPNGATYYIDGQIEYESPATETFTYYFTNHSIDNSTEQISLYLTEDTTFYTFTVTDENDNPVQDVYIHILAYDIPTDSSTLSEIIKTDNLGQAFGNVVTNTQRYKFILYYDSEVVLETVDTILTGTSRSFRINLATDYFIKYDNVLDVSCRITFSNSTKTFTYIYADPNLNLTNACLAITRKSINGDSLINETCLSSTSGTISITIPNSTGTFEYTAVGEITVGGNNFACGNSVSANYDYKYLQFGLDGIFFSFILIVLMVGIFIYDIRIGVAVSLIVIGFINILGFYKMNFPALVALIIMGGVYFYKNK